MKIEVKSLTKTFRKNTALANASFTVPSGAVYGFVGPNGAGKTTAIRIMAGLEQPDSGKVFYNDLCAVDYPEKARRFIGFMPDTLADSRDTRVWEYLDFFARACGLTGQAKATALRRVGELTNLEGMGDRFLSELSKGMKQQVALARVLIHDPAVLLLDEPAAGLDPRARVQLRESLRKLAAVGKTILISSHILSELDDIVDGVVIIEKGEILRSGSLTELNSAEQASECRVILVLSGAAKDHLAALEALDVAESANVHAPKQLIFTVKGGEEAYSSAMQKVFASELPVVGMSRPDRGLEGMFMNVTKGEVQ